MKNKRKRENRENRVILKVEGADHFLMLNRADEFNRVLKEAIDMTN